jgi:vacuolar-type H+-ATPase subunit D/Vma8|tara:strand:- start:193 stop:432 length:240 start_codon:yes stop_codon:yes gene_type:complete
MSKIRKEQLEAIVKQKEKSDGIIVNLGLLEAKKHELLHTFAQVSAELEDIKKDLEIEYGVVNIDLQTGEYTEIEDEQNS